MQNALHSFAGVVMDLKQLQRAEQRFLSQYPGGFDHPELQKIGRKHKVERMSAMAREAFSPSAFDNPEAVVRAMIRIVGAASMVSLFEKPKFRDYVSTLSAGEAEALVGGLYGFLHGDQAAGFAAMLDVLARGKLAKWSLMTILPNYYHPQTEVFVKPTTAKGVIAQFGLRDLEYRPRPSWDFYQRYRAAILEMKARVDSSLRLNNAAFCGFLMMSLERKAAQR